MLMHKNVGNKPKNSAMTRIVDVNLEKHLSTKEYNPSPHRLSPDETPVTERTIPIVYSCENCDYQISFKPENFEKHRNLEYTNLRNDHKLKFDNYIKNTKTLTSSSLDFYCPNCKQPTMFIFEGGPSGYWGLFELEIKIILVLKFKK
jgi:DNA-directed RNA polymerase subunit M/transcription elongation factor TFIIS